MMAHFSGISIISTSHQPKKKKKTTKNDNVGPPLIKLSGSVHELIPSWREGRRIKYIVSSTVLYCAAFEARRHVYNTDKRETDIIRRTLHIYVVTVAKKET